MPHPRIIDTDIRDADNGDLELTFSFDIAVLVGAEKAEFDRQQYLEGEPPQEAYRSLYPDLAELIKFHFAHPTIDPCRHIKVTQQQVVVTLDKPDTWILDLDPVGFFTWHYQRICDGLPA